MPFWGTFTSSFGAGRAYPSTNTADSGSDQVVFDTPGNFTWTVPEGVTSICVLCVGGGGAGWSGTDGGTPSTFGGDTRFDILFFAEGGGTPLTQRATASGGTGTALGSQSLLSPYSNS